MVFQAFDASQILSELQVTNTSLLSKKDQNRLTPCPSGDLAFKRVTEQNLTVLFN